MLGKTVTAAAEIRPRRRNPNGPTNVSFPNPPREVDEMDSGEAFVLLRRYHERGDVRAREALIHGFTPLVRNIARRFAGRGESNEDLVQIGLVGLIKAVDRFELDRGVVFSTFAFPYVIGEIKRHFRDRVWSVRLPRPLQELALRAPREQERLTRELGRNPTIREVAEALKTDEEDLLEALAARQAYKTVSFSAPGTVDDAEGDLLEQLGEEDDGYRLSEERIALRAGIARLDERERHVLLLRFTRGLTQSEIAAQLGYSQMHISRILRAALDKLADVMVESPAPA
jgi:RNA polymerase sigma-B factor